MPTAVKKRPAAPRRSSHSDHNAQRAADEKVKRKRRQALNLCSLCEMPRVANRALYQHHINLRNQRRKLRISNSTCVRCNLPALPGIQSCEHHARLVSHRKRKGRCFLQLGRWHPNRIELLLKHLQRDEPYLNRDWPTAESFIRRHINLWTSPYWKPDPVLANALNLEWLRHAFDIYFDGDNNYLLNGIYLGN